MTDKITRDAFLYFEPKFEALEAEFAQCATCRLFVSCEYLKGYSDSDLCIAHGSKVAVEEDASCGAYLAWPRGYLQEEVVKNHAKELKTDLPGSITPEESGLVFREVRCENCEFASMNNTRCRLYEGLTANFPTIFDLDPNIEAYACCNANTAKDTSIVTRVLAGDES